MNILLADNNDSFTRNLEHCIYAATGVAPSVVPYRSLAEHLSSVTLPRIQWTQWANDKAAESGSDIGASDTFQKSNNAKKYDLLVISPGPGHPREYEYSPWLECGIPVLGICLGLQIINQHYGGETAPLAGCVHGKADTMVYENTSFSVARYHSLHLSRMGEGLSVLASNNSGIPMIARHNNRPHMGYQFHPESFLTADGQWFIRHALRLLNVY